MQELLSLLRAAGVVGVAVVMLATATSPCLAAPREVEVSKEEAHKLGVVIRANRGEENRITIALEFAPQGDVKNFTHVELAICAGKKCLVSAPLQTTHPTPNRVAVQFSIDAISLGASVLTIVLPDGQGSATRYRLQVAEHLARDLLPAKQGIAEELAAEERVTLLGLLSEWLYPECKFHGAEMGDAGVTGVVAIKCKAVLTTSDSPEQVMDYFREKLHVNGEGKNLDEKPGERVTSDRSVQIQELVQAGPSKVYAITINARGQSTTVVVSRSAEEKLTRIAWSHYRQSWP